jgi:hypothetical protein
MRMRGGRIRRRLSAAGLWLALTALILRAAIPAGYMLSVEGESRIAVTICAPLGAHQTAWLDLETGQISDRSNDGKAPPDAGKACPFALAASAALAPNAQALDVSFKPVASPPAPPRALRPDIAPTGPPLPARGPPLHA